MCNEGRVEWIDGIRVWIFGLFLFVDGWVVCEFRLKVEVVFWFCGSCLLMINVGEFDCLSLLIFWCEENVDWVLDNFWEFGWIFFGNNIILFFWVENKE